MADNVSAAVIHGFLERYLADEAAGRRRPLEDYQGLFPGHETLVARKHAEIESGRAAGLGAGEGPVEAEHVGRFRIVRELGRGGQGVVYLAADPKLGRQVAVKVLSARFVLDPAAFERFRREAESASRLEHPGICKVHEFGEDRGIPFFVMAYVPGKSLAQTIAEADSPPSTEEELFGVLARVEEVARAAHVAHEAGILHRDLKPRNVVVAEQGPPVLLDFGLAYDEERSVSLTLSGDVFGTPAYMAPEQIAGRERAQRWTDVYALGVILYECLTLRRPFSAPTRGALYRAILVEEPPDPRRLNPALSPDVAAILSTALAKEPGNRYATAAALADDLRRVRSREPVRARPAGPLLRTHRWMRRDPALAGTVLGLLLVLALGLASTSTLAAAAARSYAREQELIDQRAVARLQREAGGDLRLLLPEAVQAQEAWLAEARGVLERESVAEEERRALQGTMGEVQAWHDEAADLVRRTIDEHPEWAEIVDAIRAHPAYGGLSIEPQVGLVPLGPDPASGLFEFAHVQTGALPERVDGQLRITADTGLVFVLIPGGRFVMGKEIPGRYLGSEPEHDVELDAFFLSKYELTQGQWLRATGANPSYHTPEETDCPIDLRHPVEKVSWVDCDSFVRRYGLTLPTEAQWEYAARAGTPTNYFTGEDPGTLIGYANVADVSRERLGVNNDGAGSWPGHDDRFPYHSPVGSFRPNAFGLHDVHGNVSEFVREPFGSYDRPVRAGDGLREVGESGRRILRGGNYGDFALYLTSHKRYRMGPEMTFSNQGLRPAREIWSSAEEASR